MPSKRKTAIEAERVLPPVPKELIDQFVTGPMSGAAINAASVAFKKALIERALNAELSHHLGYAPGAEKPDLACAHPVADQPQYLSYLPHRKLSLRRHQPLLVLVHEGTFA